MKKYFLKFLVVLLCVSTSAFSQETTLQGKVVDKNGEPLIGAALIFVGTTNGTITNIDGVFSLKVPANKTILKCSFLGYKPQEINIKGKKSVEIVLEEDAQGLDEIVVVGYGEQSKIAITGAVSSVSTKDLVRSPAANMANMLAGTLSGVSTVQFSGQPGADNPEIFVRGISTLNQSNSTPLILVDGVERDFFNLDPNEVESISVLKDASATAVFGVRGANGVIIVVTRRGAEGKAKVSVSSSVGVQQPTRLVDFADSYEWATYYNEAMKNDGKDPGFSAEAMDAFRTNSNPLVYPNTDWMEMLFKKNSIQSQHNVNVSGGTNRVKYFTSIGYLDQDGMFRNNDKRYNGNFYFKRLNFRTNIDVDFTKTTKLSINLGGRNEERNSPNSGSDANQLFRTIYWATPFSGAGIVDGKWIKKNSRYLSIGDNDGLTPYYGKGFLNNIKNTLNIDADLQQNLDFITKGLSFRIKGSYNSYHTLQKNRSASIPYYVPWYKGDLTWLTVPDAEKRDVVLVKTGDEGTLGYSEPGPGKDRDWYTEASVSYKRKFGDHDVSGMVLYNQSRAYYPSSFTDIPSGYVGLVGRATYGYKSRYLFDFNIGYNGSENFPKENRFGVFPAISAGWVLTQEKFMQNQHLFNFLKIRTSYGIVGNDKDYNSSGALNRFLYLEGQYDTGTGYYFGTATSSAKPGMLESKLGNTVITWEKAYKQNYGVDAYFLKNKLMVKLDYFYEFRDDILTTPDVAPVYHGMTLPTLNLGQVSNRGFEVVLKWDEKVNRDFNYNVGLTLSYARNKIEYRAEVKTPYEYQWRTGKPVGQQFGKKFVSFYYDGMPNVATHPGTLYPGDCVYEDINKDGVIDGLDDTALGFPNYPLLNGGLQIGLTYKGISLNANLVGATLTSRLLSETFRIPLGDTFSRSLLQSQFDARWTPETAATATEPRPSLNSYANNFRNASDLWIRDASYIRLKNIEVSYNIDPKFVKKLGINSLRLYVNGYNLFTIDKLKIADPETRTSDRPTYPVMRIFNTGINFNF